MPALDRVAVIGDMGLVREVGSRHDRWRGIWATRGLAEVLGVQLVAGRIPDRIDPEGPKVMLIASGRWQRDFAADPRAVGRVMEFADNKRFILAGVLPDGLEFPFARAPHRGNGAGFVAGVQDFWVLQSDAPAHLPGGVALARIRPNLTAAAAAAQVATQEWCSSKVC